MQIKKLFTAFVLGLGLTLALLWFFGSSDRLLPVARAAGFTVDVFTDENDGSCSDGDCSLRDAIIIANDNGEADTITLGAGTYELSITGTLENFAATGDLDIRDDLTIIGLGPDQTTIDADRIDRVFDIQNGAGTVVISGVTVFNGYAVSGGGIFNSNSNLVLINTVVVSNAVSGYGGGVYVSQGTLTLIDGQIISNTGKRGGGVRVYGPGAAFTQTGDSIIAYNVVSGTGHDGYGGGVYLGSYARATLEGGQIVSNSAVGYGGGVCVDSSSAAFTQTGHSIIGYNRASSGGGVGVQSGRAALEGGHILGNVVSGSGGGLHISQGHLVLVNGLVAHNTASMYGAGVYVSLGTAMLDGGQIVSNTAGRRGGGMCVISSSVLTQTGETLIGYNVISDTGTDGDGGGIFSSGDATLTGVQIVGNTAARYGGGVYVGSGSLTIHPGQVLSNTASSGGGLYNNGTLTLINTTVSSNTATVNHGGLCNNSGTSILTFTTIASNTAASGGGGIRGTGTGVWPQNSLVAHNSPVNCSGPAITSTGHNLDSGTTCGFSATGDITDTDPLIGPLGAGVYPLLFGSPAIDKGVCVPGIPTDQRGIARPQGAGCDIGAYEFDITVPLAEVSISGPGAVVAGTNVEFVANSGPVTATPPITYVWQATGQPPETHLGGGISDTISFAWNDPGSKTITITASNIANTAQATHTVEVSVIPVLAIVKDGPAEVGEGAPITYTLTVSNGGSAAATSLVITDALPAGAYFVQALDGGQLVGGDVVSWSLASLGTGADDSVRFVVNVAQTITNADYRVSAGGGYSATGDVPVVTVVTPATIRYVAPGGNDSGNRCGYSALPCATIQRAVDVAAPGDEVCVAAGTYTGTREMLDSRTSYTYTQVVFITESLTLRGGYAAANWGAAPNPSANRTVIDAERSGRGMSIVGASGDQPAVTVDGFTVTGGDYTGLHNASDSSRDLGGGIYGQMCALTLRNSVITDNIAGRGPDSRGGGIYLEDPDASPGTWIETTTIISNSALGSATYGGGMFILDASAPVTIARSTFHGNLSSAYDGGLGVVRIRDMLTIVETDFISNTAQSGGNGAARVYFQSGGDLWMDRVRFQGNYADRESTLRLDGWGTSPRARLTNVLFSSNRMTATADYNALVYVENHATRMDVSLAHVTAAGNWLPTFMYAHQNPDDVMTVTLTNTLLVSLTNAFVATENTGGELLIRHTNTLTDDVTTLHYTMSGTPTLQAINPLTGDPMLDTSYHLQEGSDAIDAGVEAGVDHDIDGDSRPQGQAPDIGADEFQKSRQIYLPLVLRSG
ncbi:MAG: choice-of-anchor Q domain-containing protein [Chloroflexota bacterium]|nr:choice-of-anchor Q domain-containing protein [Chloroflexota bacterium]